ncbi:MAG TPA: hypothetical protein VF865_15905 [Acidobacteriaceae bacterium]
MGNTRAALLTFAFAASPYILSQTTSRTTSASDLPDSLEVQASSQPPASNLTAPGSAPSVETGPASLYPNSQPYLHRVVKADMGPQPPLTGPQKFDLSLHNSLSLTAFGSTLLGAGEGQLFNSRPHYGTDSAAFGERLGAGELKQVVESIFSYGFFATAFHEDPHYYIMGRSPGHSYGHRAVYAASRVVLTRTDDGNTGINWSKLAGMASATALTNAYYPQRDRGVSPTISAYFSSLGTSALTLELHEFLPDVVHAIHHKKKSTQ